MKDKLTFAFFKKKHKSIGKGKSRWTIIENPYNKNTVLKYIILNAHHIHSYKYKKIEYEVELNKKLMKHRKTLDFLMIPYKVVKLINKDKNAHINFFLYYIEMEKMDGSLIDIKENSDWNSIFVQIIIGAIELHNLGIKHGDLAPRNILIKEIKKNYVKKIKIKGKHYSIPINGYEVKIADFGLTQYSSNNIVKHHGLKNNISYLSASLFFNSDYRIKSKKKFNIPDKFKKKVTGFSTLNNIKKRIGKKKVDKKDIYHFLKKTIHTHHILNKLV